MNVFRGNFLPPFCQKRSSRRDMPYFSLLERPVPLIFSPLSARNGYG